jgi:SAM-dependent methyltransferase
MRAIKDLYWRLLGDGSQDAAILRMFRRAGALPGWEILDVGCGYGRNLRVLRAGGLNAIGIEKNPAIAATVRREGFTVYAPGDPELADRSYDAVLLSHIIEHFDYQQLFDMLNGYVDCLRDGGAVVIATPLLSRRFFDNFDHVKPYTPIAIEEVFGRRGLQVQYQSSHELELRDLWVRRRPYVLQLFPSLLRREMSVAKAMLGAVNIGLVVAHILSFRIIGRGDAWVGLYRKLR